MMRRWKTINFLAECLWIKENKLFQMMSSCNAAATFIGELWYFCLETKTLGYMTDPNTLCRDLLTISYQAMPRGQLPNRILS